MRKRTVKLWRLHEDGRKLFAGTIEAADPRELVLKWSAFLATAERGTYFATYRGSFVGPEPALENSEVPTAKWSELRYGLRGQLEDHDGEASQA